MGLVARISAFGISRLCRRMMSSSSIDSDVSPWLMLQPTLDKDRHLIHMLYSVEDKEIVKLKVVGSGARSNSYQIPKYVGSSHGWLASFNREKRSIFLSDPVRGRSIDLLTAGEEVSRVIFSSSPDDGDCRTLMIHGPDQRLALGRGGSNWSPIGSGGRRYDSVAYSSRRGTFFCLTYDDGRGEYALQSWDVSDPESPRIEFDWSLEFDGNGNELDEYSGYTKDECASYKYLVVDVDDHDHRVFLVVRRALVALLPDRSYNPSNMHYSECRGWAIGYAHKTVGFEVYKIDIEQKTVSYLESSLDGLALFVGVNQPFAVRSSESRLQLQLQPNSIYFTDLPDFTVPSLTSHDMGDNGVFNYQSKTLSSFLLDDTNTRIDVRSCWIRTRLSGPLPLWYIPYLTRKQH